MSSAVKPKSRCAPEFQEVTIPSRVLLTMPSSEESMMAAKWARARSESLSAGGTELELDISFTSNLSHTDNQPKLRRRKNRPCGPEVSPGYGTEYHRRRPAPRFSSHPRAA